MKEKNETVGEKEWLDLAWKYFQQHAQQRVSYFNFFVIFSTILTTGFIATFQSNYKLCYLGIPIGLIQIFVAFIFLKIDLRNKFLTRNAEQIIQNIETSFDNSENNQYSLFRSEARMSQELKNTKKFFLFKQWSHGQTYFLFYIVFGLLGLGMSVFTFFYKADNSNLLPKDVYRNNEIIINRPKTINLKCDTANN